LPRPVAHVFPQRVRLLAGVDPVEEQVDPIDDQEDRDDEQLGAHKVDQADHEKSDRRDDKQHHSQLLPGARMVMDGPGRSRTYERRQLSVRPKGASSVRGVTDRRPHGMYECCSHTIPLEGGDRVPRLEWAGGSRHVAG
jgi:hypothetical protein